MESRSLIDLAEQLPSWQPLTLHEVGQIRLKLFNAGVQTHAFDVHDRPETLICVRGPYAIETSDGRISIPEGASFTVPPGLSHRPANTKPCVILVLS